MRKIILILLIAAVVMIFASCSKADVIILKNMNGKDIEISTEGMTDDQIKALEDVASGDSNIMELLKSGSFTPEEISEMGFAAAGKPFQADGMRSMDFSDVAIEELNLDGLSQEQIDAIEDIISGELTVQEATQDGVLSMEDLMETGLVGKMPQGNAQREKPAN